MKKKRLLLGIPFLLSFCSCSEEVKTESYFQYAIDGKHVTVATDFILTSNNKYAFVGETTSLGSDDILFFVTDQFGNVESSCIIKADSTEVGWTITEAQNGGFLLGGHTNSFGNNLDDFPIIKIDSLGEMEWSLLFGGYNFDYAMDSYQDEEGSYLITGYTYSYGVGEDDVFIIKLTEEGDTLWTRRYGGKLNEHSYAIQPTSDGAIVIAGFTKSFGNGYYDTYVIKVDEKGDTLWTRTFGGEFHDRGFGIYTEDDGSILISGGSESAPSNMDAMLFKLNSNGDLLWVKTYCADLPEIATSIDRLEDGYILSGYTASNDSINDHMLIRTDLDGNLLWSKVYGVGKGDEAYRAINSGKGSIIVVGKIPGGENKPYDISFLELHPDGSDAICNEKEVIFDVNIPVFLSNYTTTQITSGFDMHDHNWEVIETELYFNPLCKKPD